jgi:HlyD family secretion protein
VRAWKKRILWIVALLVVVSGAFAYYRYGRGPGAPVVQYKTAPIEKKRIVGRVTATGTLQARVTVQVGSQVSGRIQKLLVTYNSTVTKGQLIAKIEPQLFQAAVEQAQANLGVAQANVTKAKAQLFEAERVFARAKALKAENLASQQEVDAAETNVAVAKAGVDVADASIAQARAALNQAQANLSYTNIYSPIDGTVISRSVDVGQTVAASLQAPVLFTIAEDLKKMHVNTNVSEGDVGRLQPGMKVSFGVDAYPGQRFRGTIGQIRNSPQTVQNVVTYDAVVDVDNDDLKLRPGMTANVTVIYAERDAALAVPNAALRFRLPPEATPSASSSATASASGAASSDRARGRGRPAAPAEDGSVERTVYVLRGGIPQQVAAKIGLSDGTVSELVGGDLPEGSEVVVDATVAGRPASAPPPATGFRRMF